MPEIPAPINGDFIGKDIISIEQFDKCDVERLFNEAEAMQKLSLTQDEVYNHIPSGSNLLQGKRLVNLFYEPSTRTSSSFAAAMQSLGGNVISINEVNYSSVAKGEDLEDTVSTLERYGHMIVLRHKEVGSAALAAAAIKKPIINAGDGIGEHPTQALLDLFTISEKREHLDDLSVTMLGDLKNGRTVHSLVRLLSMYDGVQLNYVSPESLAMPQSLMQELDQKGIKQYRTSDLNDVLGDTDVLYVTRVQKERFGSAEEYDTVNNSYCITPEVMENAPNNMVLMHPLPRVGEIDKRVDKDPRAAYFDQVEYGLYVRMGLLALVSGKTLLNRDPDLVEAR